MVKAKVFIYQRRFDGFPREGDLKLVEEELPPLKDGQFLAQAVYLSVDPYMRAYAKNVPLGSPFIGIQVAEIVESANSKFPKGRYVVGHFGWRTHTISDGSKSTGLDAPALVPDIGTLPLSATLSVVGMVGMTAYFGFLDICKPKEGDVVVVSGAAGAVGSLVGQIAKIKGCRVIGIAGSLEKGEWLLNDLGFDSFINYKTDNIDAVLTKLAPNGVDCYFDNVGGEISSVVLNHMNTYGRISVCGAISGYNDNIKITSIYPMVVSKQLKMEGFMVWRWLDRKDECMAQMLKWITEGKLKFRETVTEGFENMFNAFTDMLQGKNFGKAVVKV